MTTPWLAALGRLRQRAALCSLCALVGVASSTVAPAQVPEGYLIGCSALDATSEPGTIFWTHPQISGGAITTITGLGTDLTGTGSPSSITGASSIEYRSSDGALIVGEIGPSGTSIDLHVLLISGNAVVSDVTYFLGTSSGAGGGSQGGQVKQTRLLPDGRILVGVANLKTPGPLGGQLLGIVDPVTGSVTPIPLTVTPAGGFNGLAIDDTASTVYFQMTQAPCVTCKTRVYRVSLGGLDETLITSVTGIGSALEVDQNGQLIVAGRNASPDMLYTIDPVTGTSTQISHFLGDLNAIRLEPVGGDFLVSTGAASVDPDTVWRLDPSGTTATKFTALAPGQLGIKTGVAFHPDPKPYGFDTPGVGSYWWDVFGNGTPFAGNNNFHLQLATDLAALTPGYYAISRGQASFLTLGIVLFLDPSPGGLLPPQGVPADGRLALPIPPDPILKGTTLYAQAVFIESVVPLVLASTDGLAITIL